MDETDSDSSLDRIVEKDMLLKNKKQPKPKSQKQIEREAKLKDVKDRSKERIAKVQAEIEQTKKEIEEHKKIEAYNREKARKQYELDIAKDKAEEEARKAAEAAAAAAKEKAPEPDEVLPIKEKPKRQPKAKALKTDQPPKQRKPKVIYEDNSDSDADIIIVKKKKEKKIVYQDDSEEEQPKKPIKQNPILKPIIKFF